MENLLYLLLIILSLEAILFVTIKISKKNFKWLINSEDEFPKFTKKKLKNFYTNSYDSVLGWDRKKNSSGHELGEKKTFFKIAKQGYRGKPKFKKKGISVFGDSFAFCRYVNDDQTWENHLEEKLKINVQNYGVGNYGLDQSYLKFLRYKKKIKNNIIIFNVVPETIARINSYWKHYREFGNIFGFKPFYEFKNNKLKLKKIFLKKNFTEKQIHKNLHKIKKIDIFYQEKFNKNKFQFPYTLTMLKNFNLYSNILINLSLAKITGKKKFFNSAVSIILKKNIEESHKMYDNIFYQNKLKSLIYHLNENLKKNNFKMILLISPQLLDFTVGNYKSVQKFYEKIGKEVLCVDLYKEIKNKKLEKYYLKDLYGGHFNQFGNKFVSKVLYKYIKNKNIL